MSGWQNFWRDILDERNLEHDERKRLRIRKQQRAWRRRQREKRLAYREVVRQQKEAARAQALADHQARRDEAQRRHEWLSARLRGIDTATINHTGHTKH